MESLNDTQRRELDALIVSGSILAGIMYIIKTCEMNLSDARDLFKIRYRQLRADRGREFICDDADYWSNYIEDIFDALAKDL